MPRNKTAKRIAKRTASKNTPATRQKTEMDFITVPAKLTARLDKEITSLQKKESKLKKAHNKTKVQIKAWEVRIKAAAKAKNSVAAKKQLKSAKKARAEANKTQMGLSKELSQIVQLLEAANNKQAKFNAVSKLLNQFEKEWARNSKKAKAVNKAKAKTRKSSSRTKAHSIPSAIVEQPHFTDVEMTTGGEMRFDEASETTS